MTNAFFIEHRWLLICLTVIFLLSCIPIVPALFDVGPHGAANPVYGEVFYVPMVREVADGNPLIGNAFYFEHQKGVGLVSSVPFMLSAIPLMTGLPIGITLAFNFTLWSLIFGAMLYLIFKRLGLPEAWGAFASMLTYLILYGQLLRPVSMQLVFPGFLAFFLAYLLWRERSTDVYRIIFLSAATAFAIYDYPFLLQVTAAFLGIAFVQMLYMRDWPRIRNALIIGVLTTIWCIPFLILTFIQTHDPSYTESMVRYGLGFTHWPAGEAYKSGIRILIFLGYVYFSWRWVFEARGVPNAPIFASFLFLGLATEVVSISNVITGLDVETASHAARFVTLWLVMGGFIAAYYFFKAQKDFFILSILKKIVLSIFVVLFFVINLSYIRTTPDFNFRSQIAATREDESIRPSVQWIDQYDNEPKVIWTDPYSHLLDLIPVYSKHYVLYSGQGVYSLMPTSEVEERYLVASAFSDLTLENITANVWDYDGVGPAIDIPNTINRNMKMCTLLRLQLLGFQCGALTDARTLYAQHYSELYKKYTTDIRPHLKEELKKFHVSYIMKDTQEDTNFHPETLPYVRLIHSDGRFQIFQVQQ